MVAAAQWDIKATLGAARRGVSNATTANSSGAAVDLTSYVAAGARQLKAYLSVGTVTSTGHLVVKLQESDTSAEAGFSDITGAVFTATANSSLTGGESIYFRTNKRYVRAIGSASDTANVDYGVYLMLPKRVS
jgi:hypothetical protein